MMPSVDKNNIKIINKMKELNYNDYNKFKQTDEDISFINNFYDILDKTMRYITYTGSIITCFSFAVFDEDSDYSTIMEYAMFPEIKTLFKKYNKNLLAEWIFRPSCYVLKMFDDEKYKHKKISEYIIFTYLSKLDDKNYGYELKIVNGLSKLTISISL
jgi:hypothetical protein